METMTCTTTILKPVYSTPHPLAGERVPLTIFDCASFDTFVVTMLVYPLPAPPSNKVLKEGLLRAVAAHPHFAGRLGIDDQGRRFIHLNNEGVLVMEATISVDMAVMLAGGMANHLYPSCDQEKIGRAVQQVKLNRFNCGGLIIGIISHHQVADGNSMSTFLSKWAKIVRANNDDNFAIPPPFLDRAATAMPRSPPVPVFKHRSVEFEPAHGGDSSWSYVAVVPTDKIKNLKVSFTTEFVTELKLKACTESGAQCRTFQCLLVHIWKKITAARGIKPEDFTQVRVSLKCRGRADPPVATNFFGNMVLWAFPRLQVLVDYGAVVDANAEHVAATTAAMAGTVMCPDLEVDSWLGFQFHQTDFGTGPPCAFMAPDIVVDGMMVFVPSGIAKGGVDLFIGLMEGHVEEFHKVCYSLD